MTMTYVYDLYVLNITVAFMCMYCVMIMTKIMRYYEIRYYEEYL